MKLNEPYLKELNECLKYSPLKVENIYMKGPEILKEPQTSKIRVNKNIRNQSYKSVVNLLTMFFGDGQYYEIKKVSWE